MSVRRKLTGLTVALALALVSADRDSDVEISLHAFTQDARELREPIKVNGVIVEKGMEVGVKSMSSDKRIPSKVIETGINVVEQNPGPDAFHEVLDVAGDDEKDNVKLTVGTFNVLSQMKFVMGPTGFPLMTQKAFDMHQPPLTSDDKESKFDQSSATNTWIQQMLAVLMLEVSGPRVQLMVLQEVDFPMFEGIEQFLLDNPGFELAPLEQASRSEAKAVHQAWRKNYQSKKSKSFKVLDFPYVVYNTASVTTMTCKTVEAYAGTGLCDFTLKGSSAPYKGLFMHASSTGVSAVANFTHISGGASLDLVMGDLNAHRVGVDGANDKTGLTVLKTEVPTGVPDKDFGTVLRHVYKLRKIAQCAQNTMNFLAVKTAVHPDQLNCSRFEQFCCPDQKWSMTADDTVCGNTNLDVKFKSDCTYGSKVCSIYSELPTSPKEAKQLLSARVLSDEDLNSIKNGSLDMGVLSGYLGYGKEDYEMKHPTFKPVDMNRFTEYEHSQEDWILVAPHHLQSPAPEAHVYRLAEVVREKGKLEKLSRGLPCSVLPSDHLPVYAEVTFAAA